MIEILLSTYNGEKYLANQIDSILSQTYKNFVITIRDDCSCDGTMKIISYYKTRYPDIINILNDSFYNIGSTKSFLVLLLNSKAELICFCDQDDVWEANRLELLIDYYEEKCRNLNMPVLIHTAVKVVDNKLEEIKKCTQKFNMKKGIANNLIWNIFQNDVTGCTIMINSRMRDVVSKVEPLSIEIIQHDWFFSQIAFIFGTKFYLNKETIKYRQHNNNSIGARRVSLLSKIEKKIRNGVDYKYYDQISAVINTNCIQDEQVLRTLREFSSLKERNKLYKVYWHVKNNFLRDQNIIYKIYQLCIC